MAEMYPSDSGSRDIERTEMIESIEMNPTQSEEPPSRHSENAVHWVRNNIQMRTCKLFVERTNYADPECYCGFRQSEHHDGYEQTPESTPNWSISTHTRTVPTNAYGEVFFEDVSENGSKFVRLDYQSDMGMVKALLFKYWGMKKPKFLISIAGGVKDFPLKDMFTSGLQKVAQSGEAWIITGGVHSGVSKYTGEAMRDYELTSPGDGVTTIGIAHWGLIRNNKNLTVRSDHQGPQWPLHTYTVQSEHRGIGQQLDPNHTHFLLVDTGRIPIWNEKEETHFIASLETYHKFRKNLENEIKMNYDGNGEAASIPGVLLVIEGGLDSIYFVNEELQSDTPVLLMKGTGGAADILTYVIEHCANVDSAELEEQIEIVKEMIRKTNRKHRHVSHEYLDQTLEEIIEIIKHIANSTNITIFESEGETLNTQKEIDIAILNTFSTATKKQKLDKIKLAIFWNRIDVAKQVILDIFTEDLQTQLEDMMLSALILGRSEFVELFLDKGVNLNAFLTKSRLIHLYDTISKKSLLHSELRRIANESKMEVNEEKESSLCSVVKLLKKCLKWYQPMYGLQWKISVKDMLNDAGYRTPVRMTVYGDKGKSADLEITVDAFDTNVDNDEIGVPYKILVWSDDINFPGFSSNVSISLVSLSQEMLDSYQFSKLEYSDDEIETEEDNSVTRRVIEFGECSFLHDQRFPLTVYHVEIETGDVEGAGTDACVHLTIYGELGDTGRRWLNKFTRIQAFTRGQKRHFIIEAFSLRKITKIVVGRNGGVEQDGWYLATIKIREQMGTECRRIPVVFNFNRWLGDGEELIKLSSNVPAEEQAASTEPKFSYSCQELFLWSLLSNRIDMARIFWKKTNNPIASALVANTLLTELAKSTRDTNLANELKENAALFSKLAIQILAECYKTNDTKTIRLLLQKLPQWNNRSIFVIAINSKNKQFICQSAFQCALTQTWYGEMSTNISMKKLIFCALIPLFIPCVIKTTKTGIEEKIQMKNENTETEDPPTVENQATERGRRQTVDSNPQECKLSCSNRSSKCCERLRGFYRAPVVSFIYNQICYLVFLVLYSLIILTKCETYLSIVLAGWCFTLFAEQYRQLFIKKTEQYYFTWWWRVLVLLTSVSSFSGYSSIVSESEVSRVLLCLNFIPLSIVILHAFSVNEHLGPMLIMVGLMIRKMVYFVLLLAVFILTYAIASHAILFPNMDLRWGLIPSILSRPYWHLFGQLGLDDIDQPCPQTCSTNETLCYNSTMGICPTETGSNLVPMLMGLHMLFCNILLLNLIIAMFSNIVQKVDKDTHMYWCFERFKLINEYILRPSLPPPIILILYLPIFNRQCSPYIKDFEDKDELSYWENAIAKVYNNKAEENLNKRNEQRVKQLANRMKTLVTDIDQLKTTEMVGLVMQIDSLKETTRVLPDLQERMMKFDVQQHQLSTLDTKMESMISDLQKLVARSEPPDVHPDEKKHEDQDQQTQL